MLLLDHNVPRKLKATLARLGLPSKTAVECGWDKLENGALVAKAIEEKYDAILTRDRRFQISAAASLKDVKNFTIVFLTLAQSDAKNYCTEFENSWSRSPLKLSPGRFVEWP